MTGFKNYIESFETWGGINFVVNPTKDQLLNLARRYHSKQPADYAMRGLSKGQDLYFFDAMNATHGQAAQALGFPDYNNFRINVYVDPYNQVVVDCAPGAERNPKLRYYSLDDDGVIT